MNIKLTKAAEKVDVVLSKQDIDLITITRLFTLIGLNPPRDQWSQNGYYIKGGNIIELLAWEDERVLRAADTLDLAVFDVVRSIQAVK